MKAKRKRALPDQMKRPQQLEDVAFGRVVRKLRRSCRMTQAQLGALCGVTYQQIQKYETGGNRTTISMLFKIAVALGIAPSEIIREVETEFQNLDLDLAPEPQSELVADLEDA